MSCKALLFCIQFVIFYNAHKTNAITGEDVQVATNEHFSAVVCIRARHLDPEIFNVHGEITLCTGTLISLSRVLTAEHCSLHADNYSLDVVVGSVDFRLGERKGIMWWITHNQWAAHSLRRTRYKENDISMLVLLTLATNIVPLTVSTVRKSQLFGEKATLAGWGLRNGLVATELLHTMNATILSDTECLNIYTRLTGNNYFFSIGEFCTVANPLALLEYGDSGGPVVYQNTLVGIHIGTFPDCTERHPDQGNVHSSVHFYRVFIQENLTDSQFSD